MAGKKSPRPKPILGKLSPHPINTSEQDRDTRAPKDLASPREPKTGGGYQHVSRFADKLSPISSLHGLLPGGFFLFFFKSSF